MKKTLSAILSTLILASALTGCIRPEETTGRQFGDNEPVTTEKKEETTKAPAPTTSPETTKTPETTKVPETTAPETEEQGNYTDPSVVGKVDISSLPAGLTKLFETDKSVYTITPSAVSYRDYDTGKYGVLSMNGKKFSGALFADADAVNGYISVRAKQIDTTDISTVNSCGLLDEELQVIIPLEYAKLQKLNDRYIYAIKVTERTAKKEDAILSVSEEFTLTPGNDDVFYKGTWCVYDIKEGKKIDAASGTGNESVYCYGDVITWTEKNGKKHMINPNGAELPANATLLDNGAYISGNSVYDCCKNKLFTFDTETMSVKGIEGQERFVGFILREIKYIILDNKGEPVSAFKFDHAPSVYGDTVISDYTVYDLNGNKLLDEKYISAYDAGGYRIFKGSEGNVAVIDTKDNSVVYKANDADITVYSSGEFYKTVDGKKMRFSYKDKDFTVEDSNYTYENGLTVSKNGDKTEVYDLFEGKSVLGGYERYSLTQGADGLVYIMVTNKDFIKEIYVYKR